MKKAFVVSFLTIAAMNMFIYEVVRPNAAAAVEQVSTFIASCCIVSALFISIFYEDKQ